MHTLNRFLLILLLVALIVGAWVAYKALDYRAHVNVYLNKYNSIVQELSGRGYYERENLSLHSDTTVPGRIVLLGTQLIRDWPADALPGDYECMKRSVAHQRAGGMLLRVQPDVIALGPEAVLIEISSYNFRPPTTATELYDYAVSLAELTDYHHIHPILMTVIPPVEDSSRLNDFEEMQPYSLMDSLTVINQRLRRYADTRSFGLIDAAELVGDSSGYLSSDLASGGIGLNQRGYEILSAALVDAIRVSRPSKTP